MHGLFSLRLLPIDLTLNTMTIQIGKCTFRHMVLGDTFKPQHLACNYYLPDESLLTGRDPRKLSELIKQDYVLDSFVST